MSLKTRPRYPKVGLIAFLIVGMALRVSADPLEKIAKKLSSGAAELQNKKVAVFPFPYHDGRETEGSTIISERLITKLVEQKKLQVVERSLLDKVLKELKLEASGAIDEQSAKQIGKVLGLDGIVSGTLIDLGGKEVEVNARLIKVETGEIIVAASGNVERLWNIGITQEPEQPKEASRPSLKSTNASADLALQDLIDIGMIASQLPKDIAQGPQGPEILAGYDL